MTARLFIENREIELDETVQFAITKQFEDLSNPTAIINDWSKTVSIPFTARNNAIFGHIYNPDKLTVEGGSNQALTGIFFNPYKKLDMRLQYGDNVLMTGYAKMNEVKQSDGKGTYEITLFGELGKVFQELQKITFDTTTNDTNYLIHGEDYVEEYINKELVAASWNSEGQTQSKLFPKWYVPTGSDTPVNHPSYKVTDIIGFAPNNSFSEGFDYTSFQTSSTSTSTFDSYLGESFKSDTGVDASTIINDGLLPREYGEYRSYLQLPFVYWNKLFQMFQMKAEEITGYHFNLDANWFNIQNPYWYKLVYILKTWNINNGTESENVYSGTQTNPAELTWSRNTGKTPYSTAQTSGFNLSVVTEKIVRLENNKIRIDLSDIDTITNLTVDFYITGMMNNAHDLLFTKNNCFIATYIFTGSNGYTESKQVVVYRADTDNESVTNTVRKITNAGGAAFGISYDNRYATQFTNLNSSSKWGWHITTSLSYVVGINKQKFGDYVTITNSSNWLNDTAVFGASGSTSEICYFSNSKITAKITISSGKIRSGSYFTFNDLWDNNYNIFEEILKYCKMFRIGIFVDEYSKQITFMPLSTYFSQYTITDWTNKIDKSKDYIIKNVTFENKYVLFNYEDNKTKLGEEFKTKYGVNYGDYRLLTDYNFNSETNKLFAGIKSPITNTDNVLSFLNLGNHNIVYSFPREIFVYNKDKDKKQVDTFGCFYIHNGITAFETDSSLSLIIPTVSDDSNFQQAKNTYMYTTIQADYIRVSNYPHLDIVIDNNICVFNVPKENYTYLNNYVGKNSIYSNFWENYLNERYNIQNKIITCYVMLKPTEYNQFKWNKFVKIGNQLCIVNKIYDYDITSNQPTKVDLVTIQDINGYTTTNYNA